MTLRILLFIIAATSFGQAQMRGPSMGMGGSDSSNPNYAYMRMFLGYGSDGMMGSGMGFGMTGDVAIGVDGTAYVIRATPSSSPSSSSPVWQYELDAIGPANGNILWRLQIAGGRVSQPVLTSDGVILLTVDDYEMFQPNLFTGTWMMNSSQAQATGGHLLVISHTAFSASVAATVPIASEILSQPFLGANPAGGYLIYVVGYDVTSTQGSSSSGFSPPQKTLYAFNASGALRFSVSLSR